MKIQNKRKSEEFIAFDEESNVFEVYEGEWQFTPLLFIMEYDDVISFYKKSDMDGTYSIVDPKGGFSIYKKSILEDMIVNYSQYK